MRRSLLLTLVVALLFATASPAWAVYPAPDTLAVRTQSIESTTTSGSVDASMPMDPGESMDDSMTMPPDGSMDASMPMDPGESMDDSMTMPPDMGDMAGMDHMMPGMEEMMPGTPPDGDPLTWPVPVAREAGPDRFGTAVAASRSFFATGSVTDVVLANGFSFADALSASGLAGVVGGPVLLTRTTGVPQPVLDEIRRLGTKKVYLIGSSIVISTGVESSLKQAGYQVERVAGPNRYATAAAVARKVSALMGGVSAAFVVSGQVPWDALAASPYAYSRHMPILFVNGSTVPPETAAVIGGLGINSTTAVGGTSVVPATVFSAVSKLTSAEDTRVAGTTRFETAHNLAHAAVARGWATTNHPGIAAADASFADALVGGPIAGANGGVLLFTTKSALPDPSAMFLTNHSTAIDHVAVFGGPLVVSDSVISQIGAIVQ